LLKGPQLLYPHEIPERLHVRAKPWRKVSAFLLRPEHGRDTHAKTPKLGFLRLNDRMYDDLLTRLIDSMRSVLMSPLHDLAMALSGVTAQLAQELINALTSASLPSRPSVRYECSFP
jgi:hypothetical protein